MAFLVTSNILFVSTDECLTVLDADNTLTTTSDKQHYTDIHVDFTSAVTTSKPHYLWLFW